MPISGTIPFFDISTNPENPPTVVTVTGSTSAQATGSNSSETLQALYRRAVNILAVSGVVATSGSTSGLVGFSAARTSGFQQLQRELAMRAADIESQGLTAAARLLAAQAILAVSGEMQQ